MTDPINPWLDADELKQLAESLMQTGNKAQKTSPPDAGFGDSFVGFAGGSAPSQASQAATSTPPPPASQAPNTSPPAPSVALAPLPETTSKPAPAAIPASRTLPPAPAAPPVSTAPPAKPRDTIPPTQPRAISIPPIVETRPMPQAAPVETTSPAAPEPIDVPTRTEAAVGSPEQLCEEFENEMNRQYGSGSIFILNRNGHTVFGKNNHPQFQFIAQSLTKHSKRRGLPKGHIHIKVGPAQTLEIIPLDLPNGGWVIGTVVPKPLQPDEIAQWVSALSKLSSSLIQL